MAGPRLAPPTAQRGDGLTYTGQDPQMDFLMAEAGKAFTTFEAFFAATFTSLPNIMRLPVGRRLYWRAALRNSAELSMLCFRNVHCFLNFPGDFINPPLISLIFTNFL